VGEAGECFAVKKDAASAVHYKRGRGSSFFLFVDRETLAASDVLSVEWTTGKGERVRLGD